MRDGSYGGNSIVFVSHEEENVNGCVSVDHVLIHGRHVKCSKNIHFKHSVFIISVPFNKDVLKKYLHLYINYSHKPVSCQI